jgi:hypothetical protein
LYQKSHTIYSLDTRLLILLITLATCLFLYNSFNVDLGVNAQGQSAKPITIEIPKGAQNPSNNQFYVPSAAGTFTGSQVTWTNNDTFNIQLLQTTAHLTLAL